MPVYPPPGGGAASNVVFADEGSAVGTGTILNFVGAGVAATFSGGTAIATISGGTVASAFVGAKVYNAGTQSITHDTVTAVTFGAEEFDTDAFHNTGANTSRMTIPAGKDGKYLVVGGTRFAANATGGRSISIAVNGTRVRSQSSVGDATANVELDGYALAIVNVVATDYIELMVYQASGGNLNVGHATAPEVQSHLGVQWLGA